MNSRQAKQFLSPHAQFIPGARSVLSPLPGSRASRAMRNSPESVIARREDLELFRQQKEHMLKSHLPTRFILGKVVEDVIHDDTVDEEDDLIITRALDKQQEVWNLIMLTNTLILGFTFPQTTEQPEVHADFEAAFAAKVSAVYTLLMTMACVGFMLGICTTGLIYAYSKVLYLPADVIWFFVSVQHQGPIVLMIASLVLFFLGGVVGSYLAHGPMLGAAMASVWLVALLFLAWAWNHLRHTLMGRFTTQHKLQRTLLHGERTERRGCAAAKAPDADAVRACRTTAGHSTPAGESTAGDERPFLPEFSASGEGRADAWPGPGTALI